MAIKTIYADTDGREKDTPRPEKIIPKDFIKSLKDFNNVEKGILDVSRDLFLIRVYLNKGDGVIRLQVHNNYDWLWSVYFDTLSEYIDWLDSIGARND